MQSGFLRIRATYDPNYHDPYGYNRKWYCGLLRTAFADGSSNLPAISYGYFEFTILAPNAAAATGAVSYTHLNSIQLAYSRESGDARA